MFTERTQEELIMNKVLSLACVTALTVSLVGCGGDSAGKKEGNYVTLEKRMTLFPLIQCMLQMVCHWK